MQATRQAILDYLRANREGTVRDLSETFHFTPTGIRQHLAVLARDGLVVSRDLKGRVGRPALVYRLSEDGEALYPKGYNRLAVALLEAATDVCDDDASRACLLTALTTRLGATLPDATTGTLLDRATAIADHYRAEGNIVTVEEPPSPLHPEATPTADAPSDESRPADDRPADHPTEVLLVQHTCPYLQAAEASPLVCEVDIAALERATACAVTLVTSRPHGDDHCTFRLALPRHSVRSSELPSP